MKRQKTNSLKRITRCWIYLTEVESNFNYHSHNCFKVEKIKEAEKIMSAKDFQEAGDKVKKRKKLQKN